MKISCPHCLENVEAGEEWAGLQADCPHCGQAFMVPPSSPSSFTASPPGPQAGVPGLPEEVAEKRTKRKLNRDNFVMPILYGLTALSILATLVLYAHEKFGARSTDLPNDPVAASSSGHPDETHEGSSSEIKFAGGPETREAIVRFLMSTVSRKKFEFQGFEMGQSAVEVAQNFETQYGVSLTPLPEDATTLTGGIDYEWQMLFHFHEGRLTTLAKTYEKDRDSVFDLLTREFGSSLQKKFTLRSRSDGSTADHWRLRFENASGVMSDTRFETGFAVFERASMIRWISEEWATQFDAIHKEVLELEAGRGQPNLGYRTEDNYMTQHEFENSHVVEAFLGKENPGSSIQRFGEALLVSTVDEMQFFCAFFVWPSSDGVYSVKPATGHSSPFVSPREWRSSDYKTIEIDWNYISIQGTLKDQKL